MGKVVSTLVTVVVAVAASAGLWVGANLLFNQVRNQWRLFITIVGVLIGFLVGMLLSGNRVTVGSEGGFLNWVWLPVVSAIAFGAIALVVSLADDPRRRLILSVATFGIAGVAFALLIREEYQPGLDVAALLIWTVVGVAAGAGISQLRQRPHVLGILTGGAIGFFIGAWGGADIGAGSVGEALIASAVPAGLLGVRLGYTKNPELQGRARIDQKSRGFIFLGPAMLFILAALVIPAIRTIYLSFLDRDSEEFVGVDNYQATFDDPITWNSSNWTAMFTSRLFYIAVALLTLAVIAGVTQKRRTGKAVEIGGPTVAPLVIGAVLLATAAFTAFRGTIINNLWWVVIVTFASTSMGLAVAVLADNAKGEKAAKSIIFMPMAISLVGASVIWRFMYISRDTTLDQTGVLNALWVGLGRLSTGDGLPTLLIGAVLGLALLALAAVIGRALVRQAYGKLAVPAVAFLLLGWLFVRYIGSGVGGYKTAAGGDTVPDTISFIQEGPYNNMWLMVILIWIQTGFAMVILSAAIKAVPEEYIEAARVDGATKSQTFWRIVLPSIATTIGVVVTTLIVLVMKVYDIVKVVTNGNFGTQVLANDMAFQAFQSTNNGRGAALAVLILVSVLPVMYFNIRRMQENN